jgi:hypothetical protein
VTYRCRLTYWPSTVGFVGYPWRRPGAPAAPRRRVMTPIRPWYPHNPRNIRRLLNSRGFVDSVESAGSPPRGQKLACPSRQQAPRRAGGWCGRLGGCRSRCPVVEVAAFVADLATARDRSISLAMPLGGLRAGESVACCSPTLTRGCGGCGWPASGRERIVPVDRAFFTELATYLDVRTDRRPDGAGASAGRLAVSVVVFRHRPGCDRMWSCRSARAGALTTAPGRLPSRRRGPGSYRRGGPRLVRGVGGPDRPGSLALACLTQAVGLDQLTRAGWTPSPRRSSPRRRCPR